MSNGCNFLIVFILTFLYSRMNGSKLFLIVGNSGSGKDSILANALENWNKEKPKLIVPRRYITRPESPETEKYHSITVEKFKEMEAAGEFVLKWISYQIHYGVSKDILKEMEDGNLVIVNVSRQIINQTRNDFPGVRVIFVKVPLDVLISRIRERGRETEEQIQKRIDRAKKNVDLPGADFVLENVGTIEEAGSKLIRYLNVGTIKETGSKFL
ncbi:MAG: hypothetical protein ACFFCS_21505 [Candidatus Hodarchaeota archaeon]